MGPGPYPAIVDYLATGVVPDGPAGIATLLASHPSAQCGGGCGESVEDLLVGFGGHVGSKPLYAFVNT